MSIPFLSRTFEDTALGVCRYHSVLAMIAAVFLPSFSTSQLKLK
ncbi:hypothetical protein P9853_37 [Streptococcus phage P9853]|uniref:Uncharacterized protein n=1 Tax=Streptococcus phage P9853 TaxID=1971445 RepID=A0A286QRR8_9CAUD|nr:hypothetical protein PQF06_gp37 [Streptococcus phage P9853]ARU14637.1 hypothetical protein P9853_37 [Streptococcus phage P9853]